MLQAQKPRLGLALGSGAARGWAHIGVLHALTELGIRPDVVCGTSIGALVGGCYLSGHLATLDAWARALTRLRMVRYLNIRLARRGLIAGNRLFAEMERYLAGTRMDELPVPFVTVATDLQRGREIWLSSGPLVDGIRASFALPGVFMPAYLDGRWLIDGALVNPVPVSVCRAFGAEVIVAVNLNANGFVRLGEAEIESSSLAAEAKAAPRAPRPRGRAARYAAAAMAEASEATGGPNLLAILAATLNIVQDRVTRSRLAADPPDFNIVPKVGHVGLLDFHRAADLIEAGRNAVYQLEAQLDDLLPQAETVGE